MLFAGSVNSKEVSPKEDKREYLVMILKKKKKFKYKYTLGAKSL